MLAGSSKQQAGRGGGSNSTSSGSSGIWVGIDLGTSNCACAVWDSTRGGAKWMRLPRHLLATPFISNGKDGRTVPSAVLLTKKLHSEDDVGDYRSLEYDITSILRSDHHAAWVGEAALQRRTKLQQQNRNDNSSSNNNNNNNEEPLLSATTTTTSTLVQSVKRILGKRLDELSPDLVRSLPLELIQEGEEDDVSDGFVRVPEEEEEEVHGRKKSTSSQVKEEWDKFVRIRVIPEQDHDLSHFNEEDGPHNIPPLVASSLSLSPVQIQALLLRSIRLAAQEYLQHRKVLKKRLQVPGGGSSSSSTTTTAITNVVVGVPAHFSSTQRQLVQDACRLAGFTGHVSTLTESTAAAMAYGLSFHTPNDDDDDDDEQDGKHPQHQTILVVDMGGGTSDVTIATKEPPRNPDGTCNAADSSGYSVVVTEGDAELGGDDMDQAILEYVLEQTTNTKKSSSKQRRMKKQTDSLAVRVLSLAQRRSLLQSCRAAKEALCDNDAKTLPAQVEVDFQGQKVDITQDDLETILTPWMDRARILIQTAVQRFQETKQEEETNGNCHSSNNDNNNSPISEVVLVGGATRVPAVRKMLQELFPQVELCTSLDPMGSVAQGLAIQAAFLSKDVPKSLLKSALMLDSIPHAIGVLVGHGGSGDDDNEQDESSKANHVSSTFVSILKRNARLPAMGFATFALADPRQPGVTIRAVEQIGDDEHPVYEPLSKEDFTFLLRRLPEPELQQLIEQDPPQPRTIEVGMKMDTDGKFIVSIFDKNDPEQVRRKERFQRLQQANDNPGETVSEWSYISDLVMAETEMTMEQWFLLTATIGLFLFYIAIKIAFAEPVSPDQGARIL
jgi:molecular chaperone DnaK (HSP70)